MPQKKSASRSSTRKASSKAKATRPRTRGAGSTPPAALPKRNAKGKGGVKPAAKTAKTKAKAKAQKPESAEGRTKVEDQPTEAVGAAARVVPAAAAKPKRRGPPTVDELREMPTEEVWAQYRTAAAQRPRDETRMEQLRNVLMEMHYPLVRHIAERLLQTLPKSIELDDLVSAGLFGLMDAIRGFDPTRGIKFKTYCTTRIRGSILDQLRSQDWVPRLVRLKAGRIDKALHKLQGEYGREPTHAELAAALEMDHSELTSEISSAHAKTMFSLSERWDDRDDDNAMEKVEIVEDQKSVDPIGELNRRDLMLYITKSLTHKERFIIEQYYQVGHTMREIGEMLALTESRVCQIHSNVMSRLKGILSPSSGNLET